MSSVLRVFVTLKSVRMPNPMTVIRYYNGYIFSRLKFEFLLYDAVADHHAGHRLAKPEQSFLLFSG